MGRECPWVAFYDPSRTTLGASLEYAKEDVNVAAQFVGDYLSGGDVDAPIEIERGHGATIQRGQSKLAVYRDEHGTVSERSAVCPHLGCIARWNTGERTWDCPCHGASFDRIGRVISGPANSNLASVEPR
jgi:Rieske Fe-S protein